jgi:hypothetical protein
VGKLYSQFFFSLPGSFVFSVMIPLYLAHFLSLYFS